MLGWNKNMLSEVFFRSKLNVTGASIYMFQHNTPYCPSSSKQRKTISSFLFKTRGMPCEEDGQDQHLGDWLLVPSSLPEVTSER